MSLPGKLKRMVKEEGTPIEENLWAIGFLLYVAWIVTVVVVVGGVLLFAHWAN